MFTRTFERAGAIALAIGSLGFVVIFLYLQSTFGYPDILDHSAAEVLPRLAAGGRTLHTTWLFYAALPLTLLVAGLASMPLLEDGGGRGLARLGGAAAVLAAIAMMVGLLRWPTLHAVLAERWDAASADQRAGFAALFDGANRYLGNMIGELCGELSLAAWFATIGIALRRSERSRVGTISLVAAAIVGVGALRQFTALVDPVAAISNLVLPLWLVVTAVLMWQHGAPHLLAPRACGARIGDAGASE